VKFIVRQLEAQNLKSQIVILKAPANASGSEFMA